MQYISVISIRILRAFVYVCVVVLFQIPLPISNSPLTTMLWLIFIVSDVHTSNNIANSCLLHFYGNFILFRTFISAGRTVVVLNLPGLGKGRVSDGPVSRVQGRPSNSHRGLWYLAHSLIDGNYSKFFDEVYVQTCRRKVRLFENGNVEEIL